MTENTISGNNEKVLQIDESTVKHIYESKKHNDKYVFGVYTDSVSTTNSSEPIRELIEQFQLALGTTDIELQDTYTRIESNEPIENDIEVRFELLGKNIPIKQVTALFDICYNLNQVDGTTSLRSNEEAELQLQGKAEGIHVEIDVHVNEINEWTLYSITYTLLSYTPD